MGYATEMKNLVENIKSSTKDRLQFVKNNQKNTRDLLTRFDKELKDMAQDLKNKAKDLKDFLAKSEETRMAGFKATMKDVQSRVSELQKHVAGLLGECAKERKEAHGYWEALRKKERVMAEEKAEEAEKEEKKAKKHKAE